MEPRPLLLTKLDIIYFYKVDKRTAAAVTANLEPCGSYGTRALYARREVEQALKGLK